MRRVLSTFVLAMTAAVAAPACIVSGTAGMRGTIAYSQPPPPQEEVVETRPGYVWISGRWDYQNGQWAWINGRWEQDRQGYAYNEGQWVQRGSSWHWVEGNWIPEESVAGQGGVTVSTGHRGGPERDHYDGRDQRDQVIVNDARNSQGGVAVSTSPNGGQVVSRPAPTGMYPTEPPPPPRVESVTARAGYLWVNGRYDWRNGRWEWIDGHWEHKRANQSWQPGRWELQGNYYIWIEGAWR